MPDVNLEALHADRSKLDELKAALPADPNTQAYVELAESLLQRGSELLSVTLDPPADVREQARRAGVLLVDRHYSFPRISVPRGEGLHRVDLGSSCMPNLWAKAFLFKVVSTDSEDVPKLHMVSIAGLVIEDTRGVPLDLLPLGVEGTHRYDLPDGRRLILAGQTVSLIMERCPYDVTLDVVALCDMLDPAKQAEYMERILLAVAGNMPSWADTEPGRREAAAATRGEPGDA